MIHLTSPKLFAATLYAKLNSQRFVTRSHELWFGPTSWEERRTLLVNIHLEAMKDSCLNRKLFQPELEAKLFTRFERQSLNV
jgi:hypothetical protein